MKQYSQDKNTRLITIILLAITVMTFNSVSAEDELISKDSLLRKLTEQYLSSNERNSKTNNLLGIKRKNIINPDQETSSFHLSNYSKQELINNSKLSLSPRKAQRLIGVYDILWKDLNLNDDLILEISRVGEPSNGLFMFRYNFYYGNTILVYDEIGLVIDNLMTFHVPIGDIVNIYYVKLSIGRNAVTAAGAINTFETQLTCDDPAVTRGGYHDCFSRYPEDIEQNTYDFVTLSKRK